MTDENKKKSISAEIERAGDCLKEAEVLHKHDLHAGATSRLYYYVFHLVKALLLSRGLEPKTHEGALRLLSLHFVKTEILDTQTSHIFARLMKYREEADYNPAYVFLENDYLEFRNDAEALREKIYDLLSREGFV